ncbi:hypothetical protein GIB67_042138 [Kingdonia uniflora]|uniref:Pentatricopeptide repeat-containing protein n=1 Tax=Kingdonia uniflora TaxID=39325 RepID=A0A7J7NNQ9_9MAGN|nr:hypothetical protein GIB67_042138 [Kingdonia uniflora]
MQRLGLHCSSTFVVSAALKSCARVLNGVTGRAIHTQVFKYGYNGDVYVGTAVVDMYAKMGDMGCSKKVFDEMHVRNVVTWNSMLFGYLKGGNLAEAKRVFDEIPVKDVCSWNSMISGYVRGGDVGVAGLLFREMPERDSASWNAMISGFINVGDMDSARGLFNEMPKRSHVSWITMISGYSKCGDVDSAFEVFNQMSEKEKGLVAWNSMIACYAQNSRPKEALGLFNEMLNPNANVQPDKMTLASAISACSQLGDLRFGLWVKSYMNRVGIELDDHLVTSLIDLYTKCGCIKEAYELFHSLRRIDVVAYTAMILGLGINGKALDAISLFEKMVIAKVRPNLVTFTGILTAYNHAGLVEEGYRCYNLMKNDYGLVPSTDHYGIMVDLLGRAGRLEEAHHLINGMPMQPHAGVWGALLLACQLHGNAELGEIAAQHCIELEPETSGYYSLLANIYASYERWDDAKRLRKFMDEKGLVKIPGCSWMDSP